MRKWLVLLAALVLLPCGFARADEWYDQSPGYFTVHAPDGGVLFTYAGQVFVDDEYIAEDNRMYRVASVDESTRTASAEYLREDIAMGEVDFTLTAAGGGSEKRLIAMYSTHSDESYVPTDGTESKENGKGGIYDVGEALKNELEKRGIEVVLDKTNHLPHDAGAYRRSRQTAVSLIKNMPAAVLDIHRDGIPDSSEYDKKIDGVEASRIRLLVGRSNPNRAANQDFAKQIKAVADKEYPGLIKDIFIGKGNYNQELVPHSILIEFGTHTTDKERVIKSTAFMADVIEQVVFGTSSGGSGAGATTAPGKPAPTAGTGQPPAEKQSAQAPISKSNAGVGSGVLWIVGTLLVVGLGFLAIVSTSKRRFGERVKAFGSEVTGGLIGNRRKKDGEPRE